MKKILIIGGSGFLGSHVADEFSDNGHHVTIFDKKESEFLKKNQKMVIGDVSNISLLNTNIKNKDYVYNFSGIADIGISKEMSLETFEQNVISTINILKLCVKHKIKKFVYASTIYVFSDKGYFYRCSKLCAEIYIEEFSKIYNLKYNILRYGSLYGPRSNSLNGLYKLIQNLIFKNSYDYNGSENSTREYIHVKDAAKASVDLLDKVYDNQSIIISGSVKYKISEIISIISEIMGKNYKVKFKNKYDDGEGHYNLTPYSYRPKESKKYTLPFHADIGQGIVDIIEQIKKDVQK